MTETSGGARALALEARRALALLGEPPGNWVVARPGIDHDVAIVGGGQSGLAAAFALRRAGIGRVTVIDAAEPGREGVWRNHARMATLRSAKALPGPELGIPHLTFQAWFEATRGEEAYRALARSARLDWAEYLDWFRETVGIPVRNGVRLERITPVEDGLRLHLDRGGRTFPETVRKVVLATGMAGAARPFLPPGLAALPAPLRAHTDEPIDFAALGGRTVGVIGAASSAFDAAATALEAGAAAVHLFGREPDLARVNLFKAMGYPGVLDHFHDLPDADRWSLMRFYLRRATGPIADTVRRATRHPQFRMHLGRTVEAVVRGDRVALRAGTRTVEVDFLIAGTGYAPDLAARPELAGLADHVALWADRYRPPVGEESESLGRYPYLGPAFEFLERVPGRAPHLRDIHAFHYGALMSHGRAAGDIGSLKHGVPRLVTGIGRDLFLADRAEHLRALRAWTEPDLTGEEFAAALVHEAGTTVRDRA